eukprot:g17649.t1
MAQAAMALAESVREELERQRAGKVEVHVKAMGSAPALRTPRSVLFHQGQTVMQLFQSLAGSQGLVHWNDFRALFVQLEPSLSASELESLWKEFDKDPSSDGDGSITKEEFFAAMEPAVRLVVAKQSEVIARLALALQRQGQSVDQLFNALATEQGVVSWPDFRSLFQQWEPSLGEEDLHGLWRSFDKEAPDVAIYGWSLPDRKLLSSQVQEECRAR